MNNKYCHGCKNDMYNYGGVDGKAKECWWLSDAKLILKIPVGGAPIKIPKCYRKEGLYFEKGSETNDEIPF